MRPWPDFRRRSGFTVTCLAVSATRCSESRHLAVGPTSAISLMIAASVGALAAGNATRFAEIASLVAFAVAVLCAISWLLKLSVLVRLVSDSILVGFKAGAGLTIIMTQLPSLFGVAGGGRNSSTAPRGGSRSAWRPSCTGAGHRAGFNRAAAGRRKADAGQACRAYGRGHGDPRRLAVRICLAGRSAHRKNSGRIARPCVADVRNAGIPRVVSHCRGLSVAGLYRRRVGGRSSATKHGYSLDVRQEFLGLGAANLAVALGHGYPIARGLRNPR